MGRLDPQRMSSSRGRKRFPPHLLAYLMKAG